MANFSVSYVNQFYVAKKLAAGTNGHLTEADSVGSILPIYNAKYNELRFEYRSPGGVISSDRICLDNVTGKSARKAEKNRRPLTAKVIQMADLNGAAAGLVTTPDGSAEVIPGENYILGLELIHYIGASDLDKYYINGAVRGMAGMTSSELYVRMAFSLARNMSREPAPLVDIYLMKGTTFDPSNDTQVKVSAGDLSDKRLVDAIKANTAVKGVVIKERILNNYEQGVGEKSPVGFEISFDEVCYNSVDVKWGVATDITAADTSEAVVFNGSNGDKATALGNGRKIADMEYFYMGERGDQERHAGWPNNTPTKYLTDPTKEYDSLVINFYFTPGDQDAGCRSKKVIAIVAEKGNVISSIVAKLKELGMDFKANSVGKEDGETDWE